MTTATAHVTTEGGGIFNFSASTKNRQVGIGNGLLLEHGAEGDSNAVVKRGEEVIATLQPGEVTAFADGKAWYRVEHAALPKKRAK